MIRGITAKLLIVIGVIFLASGVGVMLLADRYLTEIIDQFQLSVYAERTNSILSHLQRSNQRLEKTGLIEAYIDDFQESSLDYLERTYYQGSEWSVRPFVLTEDGTALLYPGLSKGDTSLSGTELARGAAADGAGDFTYNAKGKRYWCLFKHFSPWGWVVGYTMPLEVKYAVVGKFRRLFALVESGVSLAALILLAFMVNHLTRPIVRLTQVARAMADGDLDQEIEAESGDEVGVLAHSFRDMRQAIRQTISDLQNENVERRRAEEELGRQNEYIKTILESVTHPLYAIDVNDYTVKMANSASGIQTGDRRPCYSLIQGLEHPCQSAELSCPLAAIKQTGKPVMVDHLYHDPEGNRKYVEVYAYPVFDEKGVLTQMIEYVIDVTEKKTAQLQLVAEKERLAVTLRSIGDGVITTDTTGQVVLMNRVAEKLTGWESADAVGRPLEEVLRIVDERTEEPCVSLVERVMEHGQIIALGSNSVLISKDGAKRNIADSGAPILDANSEIVGVVLVFRDVSEQIQTEKELLRISKLESIGLLAGGIAHDFNNILTAVLGNVNLALFDQTLGERTAKLLHEVEKASLRARDLTQQLLTFAKGGDPVKETSSLKQVIVDSADFVLHGDAVACHFDIPADLWLVDIDRGQIGQVIQNIVINASHAMPDGGTIRISCENLASISELIPLAPEGSFVKISIADSGVGMPANVMEKIFDPYFTTKQEGSGLGLAISQSIIRKHDGHITLKSTPGGGTTFNIYLPAAEVESSQNIENHEEAVDRTAPIRILVMDDDEMVRGVVGAMLKQAGHEVDTAEDGQAAIKCYSEAMAAGEKYDLVIMDLTIPGAMGGKEAVQELLKIDPQAKAVVSSGYSNDPIMANCREYGFQATVTKPFQLQELLKVISRVTS